MKLLLYCTKSKPRLVYRQWTSTLNQIGIDNSFEGFLCGSEKSVGINELGECEQLNGKIVAECDYEVEEIFRDFIDGKDYTINPNGVWVKSYYFKTKTLYENELYNNSCLTFEQMYKYFDNVDEKIVGYAIHIKNLHIFDKPRFIQDYSKNENPYNYIEKAPQNMMYAYDVKSFNESEKKVLISIQPQWLCKILNGEKTIEIRKKVLKGMLG